MFICQAEVNKESSNCEISMMDLPELKLGEGSIHFQCTGKKIHFFIILMYIQIVLQVIFRLFMCVKIKSLKFASEYQFKGTVELISSTFKNY